MKKERLGDSPVWGVVIALCVVAVLGYGIVKLHLVDALMSLVAMTR